jgi:ubiquinone/menaquinone biosynthesis C-methylase UbiE
MEEMLYDDESFDVLFVCHSFEHAERPAETLREFRRVLKKGGTLFISTPVHCDHQILKADPDHINVLTAEQMVRLCFYTELNLENIWIEKNTTSFIKDNSLITVCRKE